MGLTPSTARGVRRGLASVGTSDPIAKIGVATTTVSRKRCTVFLLVELTSSVASLPSVDVASLPSVDIDLHQCPQKDSMIADTDGHEGKAIPAAWGEYRHCPGTPFVYSSKLCGGSVGIWRGAS